MKIKSYRKIKSNGTGEYFFDVAVGKGKFARTITLNLVPGEVKDAQIKPIIAAENNLGDWGNCIYKNYFLVVDGIAPGYQLTEEDIIRMKHFVLSKEKELNKIEKEVEAFENFDKTQLAKRERISDNVRLFVWQRDEGRCVKCGKNEKLEFDHIIPFAEGGGNTERNIQLLCETCNRSKGKKI